MIRRLLLVFTLLLAAAWVSAAPYRKPHAQPMKVAKEAAKEVAKPALPDSAAVVALLAGVHNGACPLPGLATGGQPAAEHLAALAKAGFTTVLDLRAADEARGIDEDAAMKTSGLRYVKVPVTPATLDDSVFAEVRKLMTETGGKGVFVHCASGNRVGAVLIPWLVLDQGWDVERAVTTAKAGGLKSPELEAKARDYVARSRTKG
jgi:uncharacterized protein (TIGR01244 family)